MSELWLLMTKFTQISNFGKDFKMAENLEGKFFMIGRFQAR